MGDWQSNLIMYVLYYEDPLEICRTRKVTKDPRLSLANKRYHVRPVLPGMLCAVCIRWFRAEH